MKPAMEVVGARQLRRTLKQAGIDVQDLKDAHAAVAKTVEQAAKPNTPRDTGALAGTLRSSGTAGAAIVRAGNSGHPYAGPIHWGWPERNIRAQPWIDQAGESTSETWAGQYLHALEVIIHSIEGAPGL